MDDQASLKQGNGARANGVLGSLSGFGNDVATLAELQFKLAALDIKESRERAVVPLVLVASGLAVFLGSLPVILLGVATLLASALRIHQGWALLLVGGGAFLLAAIVVALAGSRLGRSFESLRRTREELTRNLSWIRTVLLYSGRPGK